MVVFTYALSDFGIPKVIGGNFNMLATDIFKLVIGQQDFAKGAVVGIILLVPVAVTYVVDAYVQKRQSALLSARSVPFTPRPSRGFDAAMFGFCVLLALLMLAVLGMAMYASFVKLWPYNFALSLDHYRLGLVDAGISARTEQPAHGLLVRHTGHRVHLRHRLPAREDARHGPIPPAGAADGGAAHGRARHGAGPGLHLLLRARGQPAAFPLRHARDPRRQHVVHYYTSSHLTAVTALKQIDAEFEAVSARSRCRSGGRSSA
jgi:iron(III) transport system permease protein